MHHDSYQVGYHPKPPMYKPMTKVLVQPRKPPIFFLSPLQLQSPFFLQFHLPYSLSFSLSWWNELFTKKDWMFDVRQPFQKLDEITRDAHCGYFASGSKEREMRWLVGYFKGMRREGRKERGEGEG